MHVSNLLNKLPDTIGKWAFPLEKTRPIPIHAFENKKELERFRSPTLSNAMYSRGLRRLRARYFCNLVYDFHFFVIAHSKI